MSKLGKSELGLSTWLPWVMFSVAALFYCFVYFLRVSPGMMTSEIQEHFSITATKFGLFATLYYAIYSPTQLIVGSIIDRYGPRMVLFGACMICLIGIYLFGNATSFYVACVGRSFIGFGTAFGYVTILKVASLWLPPRRFAAAAGLTTAFGMGAAILTEKYLAHAIKDSGFHSWFVTSTVIGILLSMVILLVLRNRPRHMIATARSERLSFAELKRGYWHIVTNPQCWYIGIVGALLYMPAMVFLDIGGPDYFHAAYGLNKSQAATMVNMMFFGWIVGGPV
ncbi:MAG: MFS transporter, partial [Pseudomonadota bacterium]|nr:MFS transporter [Pseudomonadota bacterium]